MLVPKWRTNDLSLWDAAVHSLAIISKAPNCKQPWRNVTCRVLSGQGPIPEYPGFTLLPNGSYRWAKHFCYFIITRGGRELEVHRPHPHRVCGHDGHWARAADRARLAGLLSSSPKGQYQCVSTALRSSAPAQPLFHWHLSQTQHTLNKFVTCNSTCCSQPSPSWWHTTQIFKTKTQTHVQLHSSRSCHSRFLPGVFSLTDTLALNSVAPPLHNHLDPATAS